MELYLVTATYKTTFSDERNVPSKVRKLAFGIDHAKRTAKALKARLEGRDDTSDVSVWFEEIRPVGDVHIVI